MPNREQRCICILIIRGEAEDELSPAAKGAAKLQVVRASADATSTEALHVAVPQHRGDGRGVAIADRVGNIGEGAGKLGSSTHGLIAGAPWAENDDIGLTLVNGPLHGFELLQPGTDDRG